MTISAEWGGLVVQWPGELTMLFDPVGCWLVWRGTVLARVRVGEA